MGWISDRARFDDEHNRMFDQIIYNTERPCLIIGYAGTRKTTILVHLANQYLTAGYATYISFVQHTQYGLTASNEKVRI